MVSSITWVVSCGILSNLPCVELVSLSLIMTWVLNFKRQPRISWTWGFIFWLGSWKQPWIQRSKVKLERLCPDCFGVSSLAVFSPAGLAGDSGQKLTLLRTLCSLTLPFSSSFLCLSLEFLGAFECLAWKWAHFIFGRQRGSLEGTHWVAFSS